MVDSVFIVEASRVYLECPTPNPLPSHAFLAKLLCRTNLALGMCLLCAFCIRGGIRGGIPAPEYDIDAPLIQVDVGMILPILIGDLLAVDVGIDVDGGTLRKPRDNLLLLLVEYRHIPES